MKSKAEKKKTITTVHPSPGRVLVKLLSEDDRTSSGIYIPDANKRVSVRRSLVVACGEERVRAIEGMATVVDGVTTFEESESVPRYSPGDLVITSKSSGVDISVDGEEMRLVLFDDVLARVTKSTA